MRISHISYLGPQSKSLLEISGGNRNSNWKNPAAAAARLAQLRSQRRRRRRCVELRAAPGCIFSSSKISLPSPPEDAMSGVLTRRSKRAGWIHPAIARLRPDSQRLKAKATIGYRRRRSRREAVVHGPVQPIY